ncbi:hypothetical protein RDWZM_009445 [Blomia tropicalis]|uniref:Uncharacterized protein n=1 Tax=Blomia tropicalis TaxID=40697 RepID=A0A9Q0RJQ8_BLOTA|nr:hypothetical protein RDWZM_009445 [Blomia tropicalis]
MPELTANDEEVNMSELDGHNTSPVHIVDRQSWLMFPSHQPSLPPNVSANLSSNLNHDLQFQQNCSYSFDEVFCDCDPIIRRFSCYNIQNVEDVRRAFSHLLNATRMVYWSQLEVHCVEPLANDEPADKNVTPQKSFHVSYEMFTEGPKFESILFVGDCSKPKHYDNLITVDREVQKIIMIKNMLRMATSCSLLQPKFERLTELIIKDCIVAGQYGTRNEPMQLTKLIISSCNISLVESGAFYNFAELELIDLSSNQISHLSRQAFAPHLYRLRTLKLQNNLLTNIPNEFFEKLPELREVDLSTNRLTTLPPLPSAGPGVAQVLQMANNPWDCRCRLTWVLEEPIDSARLIADVPICMTPINLKNMTLFKGLQLVQETFC